MIFLLASVALSYYEPDIVWTWTNSSDPTDPRTREWNELYHSIRLFKKYAFNYNRLIVVTPAHTLPTFGNPFEVEYVDRTVFVTDFPESHNSYVIEFQLHRLIRLLNLSSTIIYLNDDWMVTRPFDAGTYCNSGPCQESWGKFGYHYNGLDTYIGAMTKTNREAQNHFNHFTPTFQMAHVPFCVRMPVMTYIWNHFDVIESFSNTRSINNFQFQYLHALTDLYSFNRSPCKCDYHLINANGPLSNMIRHFRSVAKSPKQFVCVNDDIEMKYMVYRKKIADVYDRFLSKL